VIGLPYGEKCDDMLSRFPLIPERDGQTDGRTDRFAISMSRVRMLTRDKTGLISICLLHMDIQSSTKSYQLQEGGEGAKQPPDKGSALGQAGVSAPIPQL